MIPLFQALFGVKRKGPFKMKFALVSESKNTDLSFGTLGELGNACEEQLFRDVAPMNECYGAPVRVVKSIHDVQKDECPMVVFDDADVAGALGYHDVTPTGQAYGKVFLQTILDAGGTLFSGELSLSVTLSHEFVEALGDPYANVFAQIAGEPRMVAWELGDPVEDCAYAIGRVSVSNFVTPRWFRAGPGPYDKMGILSAPFTRTPGGYRILQDLGAESTDGPDATKRIHLPNQRTMVPKGNTVLGRRVDWGENVPTWKREEKLSHPASRTRKRLLAA